MTGADELARVRRLCAWFAPMEILEVIVAADDCSYIEDEGDGRSCWVFANGLVVALDREAARLWWHPGDVWGVGCAELVTVDGGWPDAP